MQHADQIACAKRLDAHIRNGTTDMAADPATQRAAHYTSRERWASEIEAIYKRYPLLVGFSTDLAEPGDYKTDRLAGIPVLIVRGQDGQLRAFLNMCSHRAAPLASDSGRGARGFMCPFHGWSYDVQGKLRGVPGEAGFRPFDKAAHGLKALPLQEKYGLVWLGLTPGQDMDIDDHLQGIARDFEAYDYKGYRHYKTVEMTRAMNWKLVLDTFLENYHLKTLHKDTIGDAILSFTQLADPIGNNLRLIQARRTFADMMNLPEAEWKFYKHTAIVYLLFPNTLFIHQSDHVEIWRSYPDMEDPGKSRIFFDFYIPGPAETEKARNYWDRNLDYGVSIVLGEDFVLGEQIQSAFKSGMMETVIFGRNESGLINYHRAIDRAVAGEDPTLHRSPRGATGAPSALEVDDPLLCATG